MATRLYFNNTTAPYVPSTIRGSWSKTTGAITALLGAAHDAGAPATIAISENVTTNPYNVLWGRWISAPAVASGNLSGVVSWAVGVAESSLSANDFLRVHIYVTSGSTDTPRGTALSQFVDTVEFTTTAAGISSLDQAISTIAVQAGDRVVVEIGYQAKNSVTTNFTATMNYGGSLYYRDLVANGAGNGSAPATYFGWVQFSDPNHVLSAAPPYAANRCQNPTAKTYGDFWAIGSGMTGSLVSETGFSRPTGYHAVAASAGDPSIQPSPAPAGTGETWTAYLEVAGSLTAGNSTVCWLNFQDANGAFLSPNPSQTITPTSTPQQILFAGYTAPANTATIGVSVEGSVAVGDSLDVSCAYYDIVSTIASYQDGDSAGWVWDNSLTDGDSTSHQTSIPSISITDTPSAIRHTAPDGISVISVPLTGDTASAQRHVGPNGAVAIGVTTTGDTCGSQRTGGPNGSLIIVDVYTDTPGVQRSAGPSGTVRIDLAITDASGSYRAGGSDGIVGIGIIAGSDAPGELSASGADGSTTIDLAVTSAACGYRLGGPSGTPLVGLTVGGDTPGGERCTGPDGSVFTDVAPGVTLTDTPGATRYYGPDGLVAISMILASDGQATSRYGGPDGVTAFGVVLSDTSAGERYAGPDGSTLIIVGGTDTQGSSRYGGPQGLVLIGVPLVGDTSSGCRYMGPNGSMVIGVGSDLNVGPTTPGSSRYSGIDGLVGLAFLPSRPQYVPAAPSIVPDYALWVADTVTGKMLWELPMVACSWTQTLNDVGTMRATLALDQAYDGLTAQDERDPRLLLREILAGTWRLCFVLMWGNSCVWAGPYVSMSRSGPASVDVNAAEIGKIFSKRIVMTPGAANAADPSANIIVGPSATKGHVAATLINQALTGTGRSLPITVSDPGGVGVEYRTYYGYDLSDYWTQLSNLSQEDNGPEIRFDAFVNAGSDGTYLSWVAQIGTPYVGKSTAPWVFDNDVNSIVGMDMDASNQAFQFWSAGTGSGIDKLIGRAVDLSLVSSFGFPVLEMVDSSHSSEVLPQIINDYAKAYLTAYKQPATALSVQVPTDTDPTVGNYRVGEDFAVDIRDDPIVPDGTYRRRILGIAGSEKPWVMLTDTSSSTVDAVLSQAINALVPLTDPTTLQIVGR